MSKNKSEWTIFLGGESAGLSLCIVFVAYLKKLAYYNEVHRKSVLVEREVVNCGGQKQPVPLYLRVFQVGVLEGIQRRHLDQMLVYVKEAMVRYHF